MRVWDEGHESAHITVLALPKETHHGVDSAERQDEDEEVALLNRRPNPCDDDEDRDETRKESSLCKWTWLERWIESGEGSVDSRMAPLIKVLMSESVRWKPVRERPRTTMRPTISS